MSVVAIENDCLLQYYIYLLVLIKPQWKI